MAALSLAQLASLTQQLTLHLKSVHSHNAKALIESERAQKVLVEMLNTYNRWMLERMQEEQQ